MDVISSRTVYAEALIREPAWDARSCVALARAGDDQACRALLSHLYPLALKLVRAHLPHRADEEDLVQIVFMKLFAKLDQFSGTVPLEHWFSRIVVNTCINQIRYQRVRPELRLADLSEDEEEVVQSLAATEYELAEPQQLASRELVEKLLDLLTPPERLVITLLHLEGRSVREVSQRTGWTGPMVKIRAFRARQKLKKHLNALLKESQP